ncbi:hypothetical protein R1flu_020499 [Riccia fluitans]|uniref:Uncharacterized protein n=1 Tax=Riccia fluitans TaxID=41844 RepID=A0ABD1ZNU4_9MARC
MRKKDAAASRRLRCGELEYQEGRQERNEQDRRAVTTQLGPGKRMRTPLLRLLDKREDDRAEGRERGKEDEEIDDGDGDGYSRNKSAIYALRTRRRKRLPYTRKTESNLPFWPWTMWQGDLQARQSSVAFHQRVNSASADT